MNTLPSIDIRLTAPTAVAVGYFDGVHLGHRAVIDAALRAASARGLQSCVFSFTTNGDGPAAKQGAGLLQSPELKARTIAGLGVDHLVVPPFTSFRGMTPGQYAVDLLAGCLRARTVCCGYDYRFGKGACAGAAELAELLAPLGIPVVQVGAVLDGERPISSTRIRAALRDGDAQTARRLLGRPHAIDFPVVRGRGLGRKLGFPTANQLIPPGYLTPRFGVWATRAFIDGRAYPAVTNVGVKPTVGSDHVAAESYIEDFSGDLYGRRLLVEFLAFLRPERRFESLAALADAISADAQTARAYFFD